MLSSLFSTAVRRTGDRGYRCPFGSAESGVCSASLSSMVIGTSRRLTYCGGDDYDNCPIFLARMLRKKD